MEDRTHDIDYFLAEKFDEFNHSPDSSAWEAISRHLEHTEHPIDFSLDSNLGKLDVSVSEKTSNSILTNPDINAHPIDLALNEKLSLLESFPDKPLDFAKIEDKKRKRRVLPFFLIGLLSIATGIVIYQFKGNHVKTNDSNSESVLEREKSDISISSENKSDGIYELEKELKESIVDKSFSEKNNPQNSNGVQRNIDLTDPEVDLTKDNPGKYDEYKSDNFVRVKDDMTLSAERFSLLSTLKRFEMDIEKPEFEKTDWKRPTFYISSPFEFSIQTGMVSEVNIKNKILTENIHKDALGLYGQSNGKSKTGRLFSIHMSYSLKGRWIFSTGIQYSNSSNRQNLNYYHTEIPVYDSLGNLKGYFKRPAGQSPHIDQIVNSTSSSVSIPLQLNARILSLRNFSLWTGLGTRYELSNRFSTDMYNFETEQIENHKETGKKGFVPNFSMLMRYPLSANISMSLNMNIGYRTVLSDFHNVKFIRNEYLPSFGLALIYTPKIRKR